MLAATRRRAPGVALLVLTAAVSLVIVWTATHDATTVSAGTGSAHSHDSSAGTGKDGLQGATRAARALAAATQAHSQASARPSPVLSSSRNVALRVRRPLNTSHAPQWSSSRCKGSAGMAGEFPSHRRSCHFRNLCWDLRQRTWLYHARPYLDPPVVFDGKDGMYGFERLPAAQGVHEWPPGKGGAANKPVRVKVVKRAIPGAPAAVWSPVPWSIFSRFWMWNNIGHVLGDGVLGVFWLQSVFGQYDRGNQMLMDLSVENKRRTNGKHGAWNSDLAKLVSPGLSGRPIADVNDASGLQGFSPTATRMVCFDNVLIGAGTLQFARHSPNSKAWMQGIRMNGMAPILADMRTALLVGLGLNPHARPTQHVITAFYKTKGRRAAVDMHKTLRFLRRVFPGVPVRDLKFKDQYRMVSQDTTVMLAGNGGGSFVAMFAPPGATVIFTDCNGDSGNTLRFSQEASFWTNFETMRDFYYGVPREGVVQVQKNQCRSDIHIDKCRMAHLVLAGLRAASRGLELPMPSDAKLLTECRNEYNVASPAA